MIKNTQYTLINKHGAKTILIYVKSQNNVHIFKGLNGAKVTFSDDDLKELQIQQ